MLSNDCREARKHLSTPLLASTIYIKKIAVYVMLDASPSDHDQCASARKQPAM